MPIYDIELDYRGFENVVVFVKAHLEERPGGRIDACEMFARYEAWCDEVGCYAKQSQAVFGRLVTEMGIERMKVGTVKRVGVAWRGAAAGDQVRRTWLSSCCALRWRCTWSASGSRMRSARSAE